MFLGFSSYYNGDKKTLRIVLKTSINRKELDLNYDLLVEQHY